MATNASLLLLETTENFSVTSVVSYAFFYRTIESTSLCPYPN
jgi:hypothetical protein